MGYPVRPSGYVGWGSTGATNVAEPLDSKKAVGWAIGEKPASSYFNWWMQKVDEGYAYLDWRTRVLRPVIVDDFVRGLGPSGQGAPFYGQTLSPQWAVAGDQAQIGPDLSSALGVAAPFDDNVGARYMSSFKSTPTHFNELRANVRGINARDVFLEYIWKEFSRGETGTTVEFGFFQPSGTVATLLGPDLGFYWTGPSGTIGLHWRPSGAGTATMVSLGQAPPISGYHKLTLECRGPTMAAYYDDVLKVSAPYRAFNQGPSHALQVGVRLYAPSMVNYYSGGLDRVELHVGRNPV